MPAPWAADLGLDKLEIRNRKLASIGEYFGRYLGARLDEHHQLVVEPRQELSGQVSLKEILTDFGSSLTALKGSNKHALWEAALAAFERNTDLTLQQKGGEVVLGVTAKGLARLGPERGAPGAAEDRPTPFARLLDVAERFDSYLSARKLSADTSVIFNVCRNRIVDELQGIVDLKRGDSGEGAPDRAAAGSSRELSSREQKIALVEKAIAGVQKCTDLDGIAALLDLAVEDYKKLAGSFYLLSVGVSTLKALRDDVLAEIRQVQAQPKSGQ